MMRGSKNKITYTAFIPTDALPICYEILLMNDLPRGYAAHVLGGGVSEVRQRWVSLNVRLVEQHGSPQ